MVHTTIGIDGMRCGHCVASVERALGAVDGVERATVTVGSATVSYHPAAVTPERIAQAIWDEGYAARVAEVLP